MEESTQGQVRDPVQLCQSMFDMKKDKFVKTEELDKLFATPGLRSREVVRKMNQKLLKEKADWGVVSTPKGWLRYPLSAEKNDG